MTGDLEYHLTSTGVKASYPYSDDDNDEESSSCQLPRMEIPGIDGTYKTVQFHIHTSSEHTIDERHFGAELHIVHQEVDGDRYAVIGMMIEPSAEVLHQPFQHLLDGWAAKMETNDVECEVSRPSIYGHRDRRGRNRRHLQIKDEESSQGDDVKRRQSTIATETVDDETNNTTIATSVATGFSPYMLIPDGSTYYHYDGGLTTPPCSEVVWWNVIDQAVSVTPGQYERLVVDVLEYIDSSTCQYGSSAGPAGVTSRPIQPLNGRSVERICPSSEIDSSIDEEGINEVVDNGILPEDTSGASSTSVVFLSSMT